MSDFRDRIEKLSPKRLALLALELQSKLEKLEQERQEPIAIIGIGCRMPGAGAGPQAFWNLLENAADAISETPKERWDVDEYFDPNPDTPGKMATRHGAYLNDIDLFDAPFFSIARREAISMDPQQRLLLEVCWEALENSGHSPRTLLGTPTGVFLGICSTDYHDLLLARGDEALDAYVASGVAPSIAAGRISYTLGLEGPSMAIDTACSASLVAVHLACQSLRANESRMALAGGVNLTLAPETTIALSKAHMMAPDGRCKTFDARADGFVRGEGCGIVVLKRLSDAVADGDNILAVIRGSAVNQDGRSSGITAPNGLAQEALIRQALANSGVKPEQIGYIEAHGTGTSLGDPIEAHALVAALGAGRTEENPLVVGSVKTNIGHLESAAGVAGLIKVVLSLEHEQIPANLHFQKMNLHIDWGGVPVEIPVQARAWRRGNKPRIAGVSSFGFSGTNAHLIVEEAPRRKERAKGLERPLQILALSGRTDKALEELSARYQEELGTTAEGLADVCYTANAGRAHFEYRMAVVGETPEEIATKLSRRKPGNAIRERTGIRPVFLFSGQGSQYAGMGKVLYETQGVFRKAIDECEELLKGELGKPLGEVLWGGATEELEQTAYTQPCLFALEYAIAEMWKSWGVEPGAMLGHSVGEYVAACVAGVYSLADGLKLIAARGRLMQGVSGRGAMLAVLSDEGRVREALEGLEARVSVAGLNAPESVVIAGYEEEVGIAEGRLKQGGAKVQRLAVSHGFHSPQMKEMEEAFERLAAGVEYKAPKVNLISSVTGKELGRGEITAGYWRRQVREPVKFSAAMKTLKELGQRVYLEVGAGSTLAGLGRQCFEAGTGEKIEAQWYITIKKNRGEWEQVLESLGRLYERGAEIDWEGFDKGYGRERVALPTYPFQRQRYWIETQARRPTEAAEGRALPDRQAVPADWFYQLSWEPKPLASIPRDVWNRKNVNRLAESLDHRAAELQTEHGFDQYALLRPELNHICAGYIANAVRTMGWDFRVGSRVSTEQLATECNIAQKHRMLFRRHLMVLAEQGVLSAEEGDTWIVKRRPDAVDSAAEMRKIEERYPKFGAEFEMTARCASSLAGVLQGKVDPLTLLFPGGSTENGRKIYSDSPSPQVFNRLVADVVSAEVAARPDGMIRILEVGAGTGGTTVFIAPLLTAERTEYVFTDVSAFLKIKSQEKFKRYPFFRYEVLDIEKDPVGQGFPAGHYDIVVAANVLHATADLTRTMKHIRSLLRPEGLVVLLEGTFPEPWVDLTFGLTDGWWRFSDHQLRPSYPLLSRQRWLELLGEVGFSDAGAVQLPEAHQVVFHARVPKADTRPVDCLIVPDKKGVADELALQIQERGGTARFAASAESIAEHLQNGSCDLVLHLSSLDSPDPSTLDPDTLESSQSALISSVLATTQALVSRKGTGRLWLITSGGEPVSGQTVLHVNQSPVWGLGRTIAVEQPMTWGGLLDLDPGADSKTSADQILATILQDDGEDQSAFRNSARSVARLVRRTPPSGPQPNFDPEKLYLITGGLGELGRKVATWAVERGARRLVIVGRTGLPDRSLWDSLSPESDEGGRVRAIRTLERMGAKINVEAVDVCDTEQMTGLFATFNPGELKGIIHLAATLDGSMIQNMSRESLISVLGPKTKGTWILHRLSENLSLDFFVAFSSWASVLGARRLGHYTAANHFLDAFAYYRTSRGLPAVTMNWASWDQMHASSDIQQEYARGGLRPMRSDLALTALGQGITGNDPQLIVAAVDWRVHKPLFESQVKRPILDHLSEASVEPRVPAEEESAKPILSVLRDSAAEQRASKLLSHLTSRLALILGPEASCLEPSVPLTEFGLDSLMALEFKNRISSDLGLTMSTARLLQGPSLDELATELLASLPLPQDVVARPAWLPHSDGPSEKVDELKVVPSRERRPRVIQCLIEALAPILGAPSSTIGSTQSLSDLGLDSLMALELKNRIRSDLGVVIPSVRLLQGPSLETLAAEIERELRLTPAGQAEHTNALPAGAEVIEYPLSRIQEQTWFARKFLPDSPSFNVGFTMKASPHVDWKAFEVAVGKLERRQAVLRTVIVEADDGRTFQRIMPPGTPHLTRVDARGFSEVELADRAMKDFEQPARPDDPVFKVIVYRGQDSDAIFFMVSHLVFDLWSARILFYDLRSFYTAELNRTEPKLEPLAADYRDFVERQSAMVDGPDGAKHCDYWRKKLGGELPILHLASARPRPEVIMGDGGTVPVLLKPSLLSEAHQTARKYRTTPYSFMLAAFNLLLHVYSGQDDIVVGTSASGRDDPRCANTMGYFMNLLPLRTHLSGNPTFAEVLARTNETVVGALEHQEYPFALILEKLRVRRNLRHTPLFQSFFNYLSDRTGGELGPLFKGDRHCNVKFGTSLLNPWLTMPLPGAGRFDVFMEISATEGKVMRSELAYNTQVLDRPTAESMAASYCHIVESVIRNPNGRVDDLLKQVDGLDREREDIFI